METRIHGTRISIHPLMLMLPALASMLGLGATVTAFIASLVIHEAAHLLCARLVHVRVEELRLMPFGGSARLGNLYLLSPAKLFAITVAGPVGNMLMLLASAAMAQWHMLPPEAALNLLRVNLSLAAFNLIPALPLDGGRMLYAAVERRLGRKRAAELGIISGRILAGILIVLAIYGFIDAGRLNLSLLFASVFILSSVQYERSALTDARIASLLNAHEPFEGIIPMQICAVDGTMCVHDAIRQLRPDVATLYAVYADSRLYGLTDDRALLDAAIGDPSARVASTAMLRISLVATPVQRNAI